MITVDLSQVYQHALQAEAQGTRQEQKRSTRLRKGFFSKIDHEDLCLCRDRSDHQLPATNVKSK